MRRKRLHSLCLTGLLAVLQGCSHQDDSYFPLTEGYKWHYAVTQVTRDGRVDQKYFFRNLGKDRLGDEPVYLRRSMDGTLLYYSVTEAAVIYRGSRPEAGINPAFIEDRQFVFPLPVTENVRWKQSTMTRLLKKTGPPQKTEFNIIAEVPAEVRVESLTEAVRVPAGLFKNCMKIFLSGSTFKDAGNYVGLTLVNVEQTSWYAKGVGLIKMERLETTRSEALDKGSLRVELVDFKRG